jgi:hypothetical protein
MNARFNGRGYERSAYAMVLLLALVGSIVSLPAAVRASGLECPTTATGSLSIASDSQITRMTTGNDADLAKEIDGLIGRARAEAPRASIAETANLLIAAYCPVVAQMTTRSTQEKWQLMRQFDRVLMQQLRRSRFASATTWGRSSAWLLTARPFGCGASRLTEEGRGSPSLGSQRLLRRPIPRHGLYACARSCPVSLPSFAASHHRGLNKAGAAKAISA